MSVGVASFHDAHVVSLPSQGNVYCLAKLSVKGEPCKILAATLKRKIYCLEFKIGNGILHPVNKEVQFTYIPATAEILSIDCFNRSQKDKDFVIGITIVKNEDNLKSQYVLNIYSACDPLETFSLDQVAQSWSHVLLNFIPYQLKHTFIISELGKKEVAWLLSGSDSQIHLFCEDQINNCYTEYPISNHYPEFSSVPSIVLWMDILEIRQNSKDLRLSAIGCENGYVRLSQVSMKNNEVTQTWEVQHEGPISSLRLFKTFPELECPSGFSNDPDKSSHDAEDEIHLLVTNTLSQSIVYSDVLKHGLEKEVVLTRSDDFDCVICSCVADVDMDGSNEILLGTYGQTLLVYKYYPDDSQLWLLENTYNFYSPLLAINYCDVTGDGVKELVALTTKGLHILQHDLEKVAELCLSRLRQIRPSS